MPTQPVVKKILKKKKFSGSGKLFCYPSDYASWYFVEIDKVTSKKIREECRGLSRGFGVLPAELIIEKLKWQTAIFPSRASQIYIIPIKKKFRLQLGIEEGDPVAFKVSVQY